MAKTRKLNNHELSLSIMDRLQINSFLPEKGNIDVSIHRESIKKKVEISSDEADKIKLEQIGSSIKWDTSIAKDKKILFNDSEAKLLKKQVLILSDKEEIPEFLDSLAIKIHNLKIEVKLPKPETEKEA
jgi:hypothetical protein